MSTPADREFTTAGKDLGEKPKTVEGPKFSESDADRFAEMLGIEEADQ